MAAAVPQLSALLIEMNTLNLQTSDFLVLLDTDRCINVRSCQKPSRPHTSPVPPVLSEPSSLCSAGLWSGLGPLKPPICLNLFTLTNSEPSYLNIVYKPDFHAGGNFAGVHAEGKHVIQGSSHVSRDLFPFNPDTEVLSPDRDGSGPWWGTRELQADSQLNGGNWMFYSN